MTTNPRIVENPPNATDQNVRLQVEGVAKAVRQARSTGE